MWAGMRGLDDAGWACAYYPEDLPVDWRLAYYSNEFLALLVPEQEWRAVSTEGFEVWTEETPERFRYFLEWPRHPDRQGIPPEGLEGRFGGFVEWLPGSGLSPVRGRVWGARDGQDGEVWRFDGPLPELSRLRELVDNAQQQGDCPKGIFLQQAAASPERLREIQILADLLGV